MMFHQTDPVESMRLHQVQDLDGVSA